MESQMWQEVQTASRPSSAIVQTPLRVTGVPMKGVILANRKTIFHKTRICPRLSLGSCHLGSRCNFAHSIEELRPAPNLDKTKLCPSVIHPGTPCSAKAKGENCRFAHSKAEIRHTSNMFKTNMCLKWIRGKCKKEAQCNHAHGYQELKYYRSLAMASGSRDFARESEATLTRRRKQHSQIAAPAAASGGGGSTFSLPGWKETGTGSHRGPGFHRSSRNGSSSRQQQQQQQPRSSSCASVNAALAVLYEELFKGTSRREGSCSSGGVGANYQDDSTTATDELSDFSSFSSRGISDALRPSSSSFSSCGGPLRASASDMFQLGSPSCAATPTKTLNSSSSTGDFKWDVSQLLLLRAIAGDTGGLLVGPCEQQEDTNAISAGASVCSNTGGLTAEQDNLRQLEESLTRLCLADMTGKPHYYTEPPPGFEHLQQQPQQQQQQQQHAVVDLDRLATADGLD
ncbi:zinc finger (CCCH type) protein, putative [Eimeria tenella]|uniref:Zinc finger (CCCH type) protein, putative n=1 Tax=Eimeria tenella TaxID=5802 RepID=U6KUC9_EIMTE|nr:zinc finger (CCCH type) protein, putative [Eimeria tenella]CDJ41762.1 zinc finger (CCCH type) protein, putative [Eimeria tenella]|eukprot:XP_013232512.1 zinc finger (CCCH type) protein, putative [Eimeria tenella]